MKSESDRLRDSFMAALRAEHPPFFHAVIKDAQITSFYRGETVVATTRMQQLRLVLRLCWEADAFLALVLYRARAALQRRRVPIIPRLLHKRSMSTAQICIGDPVHIDAGVYIPHGQTVIDGITRIESNVVIAPWTSIGLRAGDFGGPVIRSSVQVGTGATVLGSLTVGESAMIGANAVVVRDVPAGVTVVGQRARPTTERPTAS